VFKRFLAGKLINVEIQHSLGKVFNTCRTNDEKTTALFEFMTKRGQSHYEESVTQLEHALQTAFLARQASEPAENIVAALLHDVGHFLMDECGGEVDFREVDWNHEVVGANHARQWFVEVVSESIRLHVPAKRYLCTVDSAYFDQLSVASRNSFRLQGGAFSLTETKQFEQENYFEVAIKLRRWDDQAKVTGLQVPPLDSYREEVASCIL
ncbi:MAG: HD domain-containing protein, partial [Planctomycetota bacterium]|nr:HD domain-containing protein [Planctomycetota bacterium]